MRNLGHLCDPPPFAFRTGGSDGGGAEAAEGLCPGAEKTVQGDEGAGSETPPPHQRADQGAHGSDV